MHRHEPDADHLAALPTASVRVLHANAPALQVVWDGVVLKED